MSSQPPAQTGVVHVMAVEIESAQPGSPAHVGLRKYKSGNKSRKQRSENGGNRDRATNQTFGVPWENTDDKRNKRSVWPVAPQPYSGAHFATYPPALIEPCILACSRPGDLVLDPFFGSGTTGEVAEKHERRWIGFDINPMATWIVREEIEHLDLGAYRSTADTLLATLTDDILTKNRPYTWQSSAILERELAPGFGVSVGYFRVQNYNFHTLQNTAVAAGDFTPFCVTAPTNPEGTS